jgi:signal transduction histidine kinase
MTTRARSLRATIAGATALVAFLAVLASAALVTVTEVLHDTTSALLTAAERVLLVKEAKIDFLLHERAEDPLVQKELLADARRRLAELEPQSFAGATTAAIHDGYAATDQLVDGQVAAWVAAYRRSAAWNVAADVIGIGVGALVIAGAALFFWWVRRRAFQPVLELGEALERYGRGERGVRAVERGPLELRDISRRFNQMADALAAQRGRQLGFVGGVAHDLRTPLAALKLALQVLPSDGSPAPPARLRRSLEVMHRQIARLERMLGDLLDAARLEAGALELQRGAHDLRVTAREVVEHFAASAPAHRFALSVGPEVAMVDGDALRLEQVVANLVGNAVKYSPPGSLVAVTVTAAGGEVVLRVQDEGVGISPEDQRQLFEPFRRVGEAARTCPGSGLGLYVVQRIVEAHGGRVALRSAPGQGTTVEVRLAAIGALATAS